MRIQKLKFSVEFHGYDWLLSINFRPSYLSRLVWLIAAKNENGLMDFERKLTRMFMKGAPALTFDSHEWFQNPIVFPGSRSC